MSLKYKPIDLEKEALEDLRGFIDKLLSRPSLGSSGLTGTWRLYKPSIKIDKCIKCGICWLYCPDDVIRWVPKEYPSIDYNYCKGCGICSNVCPVKAIDLIIEGE
ncbi:MAG: 4Fe-4S binding protein [Acidilobaceae archaeon]